MTYDYHGAFDSPAKTNCHSPLFCDPKQPNDILGRDMFNTHASVKAWVDAGVDPSKLIIGAAAYGREVANVKEDSKGQFLYQDFKDSAGETPLYNNENLSPGQSIKKRVDSGQMQEKFNKDAGCTYAYDSNNKAFVSYDNIDSVTMKTCYALHQGLGGIMLWDLGGDSDNILIQRAMDIKGSPDKYCVGDFSFDSIGALMKQSELCAKVQDTHDEL